MRKCLFCEPDKNFHGYTIKDLSVKKYKYWTLFLHPYQSYLGRCWIRLNRHIVDFLDISDRERAELFRIMKKLKKALNSLFKPNLFNYAALGNEVRHLHLHIIPRYKDKRVFKNMVFIDKRWNRIHKPYERQKLPARILKELIKQIKQRLRS